MARCFLFLKKERKSMYETIKMNFDVTQEPVDFNKEKYLSLLKYKKKKRKKKTFLLRNKMLFICFNGVTYPLYFVS